MSPTDLPPDPPGPDARLHRPWRVALVVYGVLLTAGTHWPNFTFGEEMPASDKTTHLFAFAILTVILFRTGWPGTPWRAAGVALVWSVLDELTQAIPGLNRVVGPSDMVANALGCLLAGAWLTALGPVGGPPSRWRYAMLRATFDRVFVRPAAWILATVLAGVTVGTYVLLRRTDPPLPAIGWLEGVAVERALVLLVAVVSAHVGVLAVMWWWQRSIDRAREHGVCVGCGQDLDGGAAETPTAADRTPASDDDDGAREDASGVDRVQRRDAATAVGTSDPGSRSGPSDTEARDPARSSDVFLDPRPCPTCGRVAWAVAWLQSSPLRPAAMARAAAPPATAAVAILGLATAIVFVFPYLLQAAIDSPIEPVADAVRRGLFAIPETLGLSIDLAISGTVLAWATLVTRRRMARAFDRPRICRACGHDLRGTPTRLGRGRCTECGEVFLRMDDAA